jgi:hypothetical protein
MNWRQNPTRVAWLILLANLFACCVLAVAVPLVTRSYILHSTRTELANLTATQGTVQVWPANENDPVAVPDRRAVTEGSAIVTDDKAKALLTLSSDATSERLDTSVQLDLNTAIVLQKARAPRFRWNSDPHQVGLDLRGGRIYLTTQREDDRDVQTQVLTPQAKLMLDQGAFDVLVQGDQTQVRARSGSGLVQSEGRQVTVNGGERVTVKAGQPPELPVPDTLNLVLNGSFEGRISPPWQTYVSLGQADLEPGKVTLEEIGQGQAVRFTRKTEDGAPNEVGLTQDVNRDVQGYDSLVLRFDLELLNQSVPGGGYQASEYPVMVRIDYTDVNGKDQFWVHGFYNLDLPAGVTGVPAVTRGEKIPLGVWYNYESPNLFQLLKDAQPAHINKITIYAAGHDYDSRVADLALTVR